MLLFIDGSVDPKSKIGYGSYLLIHDNEVDKITKESVEHRISSRQFSPTSSTKLEIQTLIWAFEQIEIHLNEKTSNELITVFTDSQNLEGLPNRRVKLESRNFKSRKDGKELKNADLYKSIFDILDRFNCSFIKVSGHSKLSEKNKLEWIFAQVDRSTRRALREYVKMSKT